jgi:putative phosphoesterase
MKVCVISDIHANLHALEAVLAHAKTQNATNIILNLGDFVGYGAFPEAVVQRLFDLNVISVIGDYDLKVLDQKMIESDWSTVKTPDKRMAFRYAYEHLSPGSVGYLKALAETQRLNLEDISFLMSHGSSESIKDHIGADTPLERLNALGKMAATDVVLCGNTHRAFYKKVGRYTFINPGSVGRPDDGDPRASYAILNIDAHHLDVEFLRIDYDLEAAVKGIRDNELPETFAQMFLQGRNYKDVVKPS